jgi:hypothetical protein
MLHSYKMAVHVLPRGEVACDSSFPQIGDCSVISPALQTCEAFDAFPAFYDLVAIKRVEYSLNWPSEWGSVAFISGYARFPAPAGPGRIWLGTTPATCFAGVIDCEGDLSASLSSSGETADSPFLSSGLRMVADR